MRTIVSKKPGKKRNKTQNQNKPSGGRQKARSPSTVRENNSARSNLIIAVAGLIFTGALIWIGVVTYQTSKAQEALATPHAEIHLKPGRIANIRGTPLWVVNRPDFEISNTSKTAAYDVSPICIIKLSWKVWGENVPAPLTIFHSQPLGSDDSLGAPLNLIPFGQSECTPDGGETKGYPQSSIDDYYVYVHYFEAGRTAHSVGFAWHITHVPNIGDEMLEENATPMNNLYQKKLDDEYAAQPLPSDVP